MTQSITNAPTAPNGVFNQHWRDTTVVIHCMGEVDMLSAPDLEREITSALARGPLAVVIDLTEVTFLASHGMGVLVAFQQSTASEVRFAVVADGHVTRRPMSLIGLDEVLDLHPTLAVALEAIKV